MPDLRSQCGIITAKAINLLVKSKNISIPEVEPTSLLLETPPDPAMGDVGIPLFTFAKMLHMGPQQIAVGLYELIKTQLQEEASGVGEFSAIGPYLNIKLNKSVASSTILRRIQEQSETYGLYDNQGNIPLKGRRVMVEFSSPNTNKPLHLGHLRNDALGESVSRILKASGADVFKVNIINNRGVHICKSMTAYIKNHSGHPEYITENGLSPNFQFTLKDTPESLGVKSDRFVGDCYVEFDKMNKIDPTMEQIAQSMLVEWEHGNEEIRKLWAQMNEWAINGISQTYKRTGISFNKLYYESETYLKGKEEILQGLENGLFYKEEDGSVWVDLAEINLDKKVLLRKDGTALYMTQDIGTAIYRHSDWDFNQLVYVVGSEQQYHFKVLFYVLKKLGFDWASNLFHLSYGMVNLPEGKMKSREGTVVDADDLISSLRDDALSEITEKGREEAVGDPNAVAEKIALGALHYYLLQTTPTKDMLFNPKESLSFNGNTGPYLQYMGARISSILRKSQSIGITPDFSDQAISLLKDPAEWELIKTLGDYPVILKKAADDLDPSQIASYLYEVSKGFSKFYHDCPILSNVEKNINLAGARLALAECVKQVLKNAMQVVLIPFLETM